MNTMACTAMACGGTIASHHCLVRHQNSATNSTHAPMMNSVVPMADRTAVTASSVVGALRDEPLVDGGLARQVVQRPRDEEPDADDDHPEADRGQEHADGEVAPRLLAGGGGRVQLVAVQEGVHHFSWSGGVADQPL